MNNDLKNKYVKTVRDIRRRTHWKYSTGEKIRIIMDGLCGKDSIAEIYHLEGIHQNMYYKWTRTFLEASKKRLIGDTIREASTDDVKEIRILLDILFLVILNFRSYRTRLVPV